LILSVKTSSERKATIKSIAIKVDKRIEKEGTIQNIQIPEDDGDLESYVLPESSKCGPTLSIPNVLPEKAPFADIKSNGIFPLDIVQVFDVEVDQTSEVNGCFLNNFFCTFRLTNKSEKIIMITKVTSEYQNFDGSWKIMESSLCYRRGFRDYAHQDGESFTVQPFSQIDLSTKSKISICAAQYCRQRRAHKSLPQPFFIRTTFFDVNNNEQSIILKQVNSPLDAVKKEERLGKDRKLLFWTECDDVDMECRIFAEVFLPNSGTHLEVATQTSSTFYITTSNLRKYAYLACCAQKEEIEIEDLQMDSNHCIAKVYAVVDLKSGRTFALKFYLQTTTSSVLEYFRIPKLSPPS